MTLALTSYPLPQERKSPAAIPVLRMIIGPIQSRVSKKTANDSPSPPTGVGGEGRGEVARDTNYLVAVRMDRAGAGCSRNLTPRRKAAKTQSDFFYYETRKPGISGKISWFPGFLMDLFLVAPLPLGVLALKVFA